MKHLRDLGSFRAEERAGDGDIRRGMRWYTVNILPVDGGAPVFVGKTFARNSEGAMVNVRDAAIVDGISRPFKVVVMRVFDVVDAVVQNTAEVKP